MSLLQDIALLQRLPLLGALEMEALRLIAFAGDQQSFRPGDILFRENERADGGFVITSGRIQLQAMDGAPGEMMAGPGALLGEMALFVDGVRPATAIAQQQSTALKISRHVFRRVLDEFPQSTLRLRQRLCERVDGEAIRLEAVRQALLAIEAQR